MLTAARMVRPALAFSKVVLAASSATGVAAFLCAWFLAVRTLAQVNGCCVPAPALQRLVASCVPWLEILSAIAGGVAIAAFIRWWLEDCPHDCAKRVTLALLFSFLALTTAIATDIGLR
jgi:hypothetical protein